MTNETITSRAVIVRLRVLRRNLTIVAASTVLLFALFCACVLAQEENPLLPDLREIVVSGPYCGIYSLIAILDIFDIHPPIEELLTPEFVGSFQGSSNLELEKAAEKYGLYAKTYSGLTWRELKASKNPMILHFRSTLANADFNHWVAFLGVEDGKARIIDLPHPLATIPFAELLAKWDGIAIVISQEPIRGEIIAASRWHYLSSMLLLLGGLFVVKVFFWIPGKEAFFAPTFFQKVKQTIFQTGMLLGVLFVSGILYHAFSPIGFLTNPSAVAEVTRRFFSVDIPDIDLAEMKRIVAEEENIPLFDSRFFRDFNRGTIPGAVSLPINSSLTERQQILGSTPRSQRIVVFCQSSGCGFADEIAQFLKFNGYTNVVIYRGGYREWSRRYDTEE